MVLSAAPPSIMQQAPGEANAELGSVLSRALELSSAPSTTVESETGTSSATTSTESSRSSSRSSSSLGGLASALPTTSSSDPAVAVRRLSGTGSIAMQMQRRSGRSRKPSSKAVESRANAAALAAVGLQADEYDAFVEDPPTPTTSASSSRSSSSASSPIPGASSFATSAVATVSPKSGKKTWKKPEGKPKRPLSAYNIFFKEERARLVAEINGSGGGAAQTAEQRQSEAQETALQRSHRKTHGMGFAGLAQNIAGKWKSLSAKNRKPFEDKAAVDKARYVREVAAWKDLLREGAARAAEAEADRQQQLKDLYHQQQVTSASAPATPRRPSAQPVTDSSSEDETPRRRAARSKKAAAAKKKGKGKSSPKKSTTSKRTAKHQPKSTKKQRGRKAAANAAAATTGAQHHQEQPMHQIPDLAMFDPADVPVVIEPAAAISVQHYQHQPHQEIQQAIAAAAAAQQANGQPQQWDGLDQMMLGAVGNGDLQDILSLDF